MNPGVEGWLSNERTRRRDPIETAQPPARNRVGWGAHATEMTSGLSDVFELHETLASA